jgi:uncharacterized protein YgbK (DUF1537 family)
VDLALNAGKDMLIYTSRELATARDPQKSLSINQKISQGLIAIIGKISIKPRYILAKGGITSSDIATDGLGVKHAHVCGQVIAGVPVWKLGTGSRYPGLIYVVFPGNVGDAEALVEVVNKLR